MSSKEYKINYFHKQTVHKFLADNNINIQSEKINVLLAPLDWGMGHTTRCIPLISAIQAAGANVFVAGNEATLRVVKEVFPNLQTIPLEGYNIRYSKNPRYFLLKLFSQAYRLNKVMRQEQKWLRNLLAQYKIDAVISDNRFGLFHKTIPAIYITHQLQLETGIKWLNKIAQKAHYHIINKYQECWVPDVEAEDGLAGKLSHPSTMPAIPVRYLGLLSRFTKKDVVSGVGTLLLISGPEPQRSIFEALMLPLLRNRSEAVTVVRGRPTSEDALPEMGNITFFNHLPPAELAEQIQRAGFIICRSGYSTIMDLVKLNKTALLIPTPAQGEQEYLAKYLSDKGWFSTAPQNVAAIEAAMRAIPQHEILPPSMPVNYNSVVLALLESISKKKATGNITN